MATPFNQGAPTIPVVLNTSNCFVFGNTASGNALSVQQLGTGNVATFRTTTGATALFVNAAGNVGVGQTNPVFTLDTTGTARVTSNLVVGGQSTPTTPFWIQKNAASGISGTAQSAWRGQALLTDANGTQFLSIGSDQTNAVSFLQAYGAGVNKPLSLQPNGGNVGIGTASPGYQLTVSSNIYNESSGGGFYGMNCGNMNGLIQGVYNGGSANPDGLNNSDLFIGVNYNQQTGQRLAGTNHGVAQIQLVGANPGAGNIKFRCAAGGTGALASVPVIATITTTGLGIGTTNPGYALQVNGSIGMVGGTIIPLTLPLVGSQTSYSINLAASGTWYTVISDARINATITGAIGVSDLTSTIFIATLYANGGANASMVLVTGSASNIRVSGTALQFNAVSGLYGRDCNFTLLRHN